MHAELSEETSLPALAIEATVKAPHGHFLLLFLLPGHSNTVLKKAEQIKNGALPRSGHVACCMTFSVDVGRWPG